MKPLPPLQEQTPQRLCDDLKFWTACPSCKLRHLYPLYIMGMPIKCTRKSCKADFFAYGDNAQETVFGKCAVSPKKDDQKHGRQNVAGASNSKIWSSCIGEASPTLIETGVNSEGGEGVSKCIKSIKQRKWFRKLEQDGSSSDVEEILPTEFEKSKEYKKKGKQVVAADDGGLEGANGIYSRCCRKSKLDQDMKSIKERKWYRELEQEGSSSDVEEILPTEFANSKECKKKGKLVVAANDEGLKGANGIDSRCCLKSKLDQGIAEVAETDFYDFDRYKREECFAADQMWALYDEADSMPRYYAWIDKVYSPGFKVQITWLNYSTSNDQDGIRWNGNGLPVACGNFVYGETVDIKAIDTFSHRIEWAIRTKKGSYNIYPRKGETWALFKDWNVKWDSDGVNLTKYNYEYVEVLSDYKKKSGAKVAYLSKIEGFVSLFKTSNNNLMASFRIPPKELLRFSHRVLSYKMIGKEREDIPKVSFELDPASLPGNIEQTSNPGNVEAEVKANVAKVSVSSKAPSETLHKQKKRKEREDIPKMSFELDPASLPGNIEQTSDPGNVEAEVEANVAKVTVSSKAPSETLHKQKKRNKPEEINTIDKGGNSKCSNRSRRSANVNKKTLIVETSTCLLDKNKNTVVLDKQKSCDDSTFVRESAFTCQAAADSKGMGPDGMITIPSSLACLEPDMVFYDFDKDRSCEKFKTGQIWALYCHLDDLPKYYGKIKNVELFPDFKLDIQWLESCNPPKVVIPLVDRSMPICCGTFKVTCGVNDVFDDLGYFSHQLSCVNAGNNLYNIYPKKGEVWALYKNLSSEWRYSNLKNCGYYIVEVIKVIDACWIQVLVVQNVTGLKTVFQAKKEAGEYFFTSIPWTELYRFSHQIPSFKLAEAKYGSLYGCWALDPKSMPVHLYSMN
ncbi:hypothetical protein MKX01_002862 [Papaver californicum]|nr:hypothetical protein MKX01_002862 [Papaver californicum]